MNCNVCIIRRSYTSIINYLYSDNQHAYLIFIVIKRDVVNNLSCVQRIYKRINQYKCIIYLGYMNRTTEYIFRNSSPLNFFITLRFVMCYCSKNNPCNNLNKIFVISVIFLIQKLDPKIMKKVFCIMIFELIFELL